MTESKAESYDALLNSGHFDAEWYRQAYPDVGATNLDPAYHYLMYGAPMGRDPGPDFSSSFIRELYRLDPHREPISALKSLERRKGILPDESARVLITAHDLYKRGARNQAVRLAQGHLPPELSYTVDILRANLALDAGRTGDWLELLNNYLGHFGIAPVVLGLGQGVFNRLSCGPLAPVTGGDLVSVLMPAWNAQDTISMAAHSILNQTWRNLELLIVDDASTDDTWKVLQEIAASDARIRISRNKTNVGPYVSKNIALTRARGHWVTGQDSDDWSHPQRIEKHMAAAVQAQAPASLTSMVRMMPDGRIDHFTRIGEFSFDGVARVSSISTLFRIDVLRNALGFWDSVRFGADSEMISRARRYLGEDFRNFDTIGMLCLDVPTSLTNDPETGIRTENGLSPIRKAYKASWVKEHDTLPRDRCYLDFPQRVRRYEGEFDHFVECLDIREINEA